MLAGLLVYGYPILGLTLLAGGAGLPLPSQLTIVASGALAAQGYLDWAVAGAVAVASSVTGDVIGYGIGRYAGREVVQRRGGRFGLTESRLTWAEALFARWGGPAIVLTSTVLSVLSTAVNLLAGINRYPLAAYVLWDITGRLIWVAAGLALGYSFSQSIEDAAAFLADLSGFLGCVILAGVAGALAYRRWTKAPPLR